MSAPILAPALATGTLDAGVDYSYIVATPDENVEVISPTTITQDGDYISGPGVDMWLTQLGTPWNSRHFKVRFVGSGDTDPFTTEQIFELPLVAAFESPGDPEPPFAEQTLQFVIRPFAATTRLYCKDIGGGQIRTYTSSALTTTANHGLAVGDRIWTRLSGTYASSVYVGYVMTVGSVVSSTTFTREVAGLQFCPTAPSAAGDGWSLYFEHKQVGRTQGDITSAVSASGERGTAFSYTIATDDIGAIRAANAPLGLGLNPLTGEIAGTPVEAGWFPVILRAGAMQRYLPLTVEPGDYDSLITSSGTATAIVGRAFFHQALTTLSSPTWNMSGQPSGISIDGGSGQVTGSFPNEGTYILTLHAASGTDYVTRTLTVTVTADSTVPVGDDGVSLLADAGIDLFIDVQSREVAFEYPRAETVVPDGQTIKNERKPISDLFLKRGDVVELNLRFTKAGVPVAIAPDFLKLVLRREGDFDEEPLVTCDEFTAVPGQPGVFKMRPSLAGSVLLEETEYITDAVACMGEFEWGTTDPATVFSSRTFAASIARDLIRDH